MRTKVIVVLLTAFVSAALFAQDFPKKVVFNHLTSQNGLPNNSVQSVAQDKQGLIWISTTEGLCRFDGVRTKVYVPEQDNPNSLSNNNAIGLLTDKDGNIWIGTDYWINRFDPVKDSFHLFYAGQRHNR
ncbi:MAG: hypothetical protein HC896_14515 [Bacteroidales bacterium]|nr:hypothetical protein [Bacteroidales bacterium]